MGSIANSIAGIPHLKAFDEIFEVRFGDFDLSSLMLYIIDSAPEEALIHLASQFDVLGYKGWVLADTEEQKRSLLKRAIELHRYKGTVYAIEEAVQAVGFTDVEVIEGVGVEYDSTYNHDSTIPYSGGGWANFRVKIGLPDDKAITITTAESLRRFIENYKNARSHLLDITLKLNFSDVVEYSEFLDLGEGAEDIIFEGIYYDGRHNYDGTHLHNKGANILSLRIINLTTSEIIEDEF